MTKKEIQKRVLQNGKPLALSKFSWDEKTKTFSSNESQLVVDFGLIDSATITAGYSATITAGYSATIKAGNSATITAGYSATITAGYSATITAGYYSSISVGDHSTVTTRYSATITAGYSATIKAGNSATITAGYSATITAGYSATITAGYYSSISVGDHSTVTTRHSSTIKAGKKCVVVRHDVFEVYTLNNRTIQLAPYNIPGCIENGKYSVTGKPAIIADSILSEVLSTRTKEGLIIRRVINHGSTKKTCLIERDGVYSHGDTLGQAIDSLKYKISDRDTSKYADYTLDTELTQAEAIQMYRVITGACEAGTREFVESIENPPETMTVAELIELTKGQYKNDELEAFINQANKD